MRILMFPFNILLTAEILLKSRGRWHSVEYNYRGEIAALFKSLFIVWKYRVPQYSLELVRYTKRNRVLVLILICLNRAATALLVDVFIIENLK